MLRYHKIQKTKSKNQQFKMSVESCKDIEFLKETLAEKERDVAKLVEIGKGLLETNQDLQQQLEKQQKEYQAKIDEINQECYSLQKKLENKNFMEQNYIEDIENMKTELKKLRGNQETAALLELQVKLTEVKKQNGYLQQELERTQLSEKQALEQIQSLNGDVESLKTQLSHQESRFNETCSEEMAKLLSDITNIQMEKANITNDLKESHAKLEQAAMQVRHLQARVESAKEEVEEKECQICSFQNSIEKFKVEIMDLHAQIDAARAENVDLNKKGNSLFAEVDDRRCGAERELKSLRSRFETEHKNNEILKQQLHRLKMRIPSLLQSSVGKGDPAYVEKLENRISNIKSENEMLRTKCGRLELDVEKVEAKVREELSKFNSDKTNKEYSEVMGAQLALKGDEIIKLKKGLQKKEIEILLERDGKATAEKKAYRLQTELDQATIDITKLKLKIEELKLKYEPDSVQVGKKMIRRHYETIPMPEETVQLTEVHRPLKGLVNKTDRKKEEETVSVFGKENKRYVPKSLARKTVSISDDVDVKEIEDSSQQAQNSSVGVGIEGANGTVPRSKAKGKVYQNVKKVSSQVNENEQCKQQ